MESLATLYENYKADCDKGRAHTYITEYEELLAPYRETATRVLEIGVRWGASISRWKDYFTKAEIVGMDIDLERMYPKYRREDVTLVEGDCSTMTVEGMFDIVIDDGPHDIDNQVNTLHQYYPKLNSGGMIIIEDIQNPSYIKLFETLPYNIEVRDLRKNSTKDNILIIARK